MKKEMRKNIECIKDLIALADVEWRLHWADAMTTKMDGKATMICSAPRFPILEISLTFDILRHNLFGSIGKDVDNALFIIRKEGGNDLTSPMYLDVISDLVEGRDHDQRK